MGDLLRIRKAFRNWYAVAPAAFLWKQLDLPARDIELDTRGGTTLVAPLMHSVGAVYAAFEVFAMSAYDCDWLLERYPVIVDIGGNVGAFILWMAERHTGVSGVCFEPDPAAFKYLRSNLERNGVRSVEVRAAAVSDVAGAAWLFRGSPGDALSSLQNVVNARDRVRVPVLAFGDVMREIGVRVSLVKIDCQGTEYDIILKSPPESWQNVERVVVEFHPMAAAGPELLVQRLTQLGFELVKTSGRISHEGTLWFARPDSRGFRR
jgi:FkbM family methyltransferase